jgi:nucleotide-binding universal stress UspA family protein
MGQHKIPLPMKSLPLPARPGNDNEPGSIIAPEFPPRRILVPVDFSPRAMRALGLAESLARETGAGLLVVHIAEPITYPTDLGYAPVIPGEVEAGLQASARERLAELVTGLRARGVAAEGEVRTGRPFSEITETARAAGADLIMLTTHGFTGLKHVLLGSTAERVVRHAPCPVWVLRDPSPEAAAGPPAPNLLTLRRVLVPVDFSTCSAQALVYASSLARRFQATLELVYVAETPILDPTMAEVDTRAFEETARQSAQAQLDKLLTRQREAGLPATGQILSGAAWHEIVEQARRDAVDLIVTGTHGYTGLRHVLLGSTAERVVRHAPCPVLVVRTPSP